MVSLATPVVVVGEEVVRNLLSPEDAFHLVRQSFVDLALGKVSLPLPIGFEVRPNGGEVHVKAAHVKGARFFVVKVATGFYANHGLGLPVSSGVMLAFDATTGAPVAVLDDGGYLTELRTAAAGAVAADLLARRSSEVIGLIGCGTQAGYQLEALVRLRPPTMVLVFGRRPARAKDFAQQMTATLELPVKVCGTVEEVARRSDILVTTTPSRQPLVQTAWIRPGTHVTAVGSDGPDKCELQPDLLARADLVAADLIEQCIRVGEVHHAVERGLLSADEVVQLGDIAAGKEVGRTGDAQVTIADLTGLGVQDAAVAGAAVEKLLKTMDEG